MPILKNAKKALRVSKRKAVVNRKIKSQVKTTVDAMTAQPTQEKLSKAYEAIDTAVKKNIFHKNRAARMKSKLATLLAEAKK